MSAAASGTEVYAENRTEAEAEASLESTTYTDVLTATEAAARLVGRDLRFLVHTARVSLADQLDVPREMARDEQVVLELLLHDIERMLRQNLISAVHLLLSDPQANADNQRTVRYHTRYEVRREHVRSDAWSQWGDIAMAPPRALTDARFTLAISWRPQTSRDKRRSVKPPEYFFAWLPDGRNYDQAGLVRYRFGGVNTSAAQISRVEFSRPGYLGS